ncbi:MAG: oligosaccharide flippase family protein [Parvularculaceae bacterium]
MTAPAPHQASLRSRFIKGGAWTIGGLGANNLLRLASNLVMTRLLMPEAFGLMAIAATLQYWLTMMSDVGLNASVMRHKDDADGSFMSTVFVTQIGRNARMAVALLVVAASLGPLRAAGALPPSSVFADPLLPAFVAAVALAAVIRGFNSMRSMLHQKALNMGPITRVDLAAQVIAFATMASAAALGAGPLSLALGVIANAVWTTAASYLVLKGPRARLGFNRAHFGTIFHYGKWIVVSSTFGALAARGAQFIFGWTLDATAFSFYAIATIWTLAAGGVVLALIRKVTFPVFAEIQRERPKALANAYRRVRAGVEALSIALFVGAFALADFGVDLLYEDRYAPVAFYIKLAAIEFLLLPYRLAPMTVLAAGDSRRFLVGTVLSGVSLFVGAPVALKAFGPEAAILWAGLAPIVAAPYSLWIARGLFPLSYAREAVPGLLALAAAPLVYFFA